MNSLILLLAPAPLGRRCRFEQLDGSVPSAKRGSPSDLRRSPLAKFSLRNVVCLSLVCSAIFTARQWWAWHDSNLRPNGTDPPTRPINNSRVALVGDQRPHSLQRNLLLDLLRQAFVIPADRIYQVVSMPEPYREESLSSLPFDLTRESAPTNK